MRKTYLFLALIWTLIVTYLSLSDLGGLGDFITISHKDKMVHFVFYFLFYLLWMLYINYAKSGQMTKLKLLIVAIGYGILMELLQALMANHRSSDFYDVVANSIGAISGFAFTSSFILNKK